MRSRKDKIEILEHRLIKGNDVKKDFNRAVMLVDPYDINKMLEADDITPKKSSTYMLLAFLLESGIVKFLSGKGRKSKNGIIIGVDTIRLKMLTGDPLSNDTIPNVKYSNYNNEPLVNIATLPLARYGSKNNIINFLSTIKKHIDKGTDDKQTGHIVKLMQPRTFGLDEDGKNIPKFMDKETEVVYWLSTLLDKLNFGDFGYSNVVEAMQTHLSKRRVLHKKDVEKYIKMLQNVIGEEQQQQMLDSKNNDKLMIEIPDINPHMTPYGYQIKGINYCVSAKRGVIAFDLGLGKTLIATIVTYILKKLKRIKGSIIFTRLSIIPGFEREIKKVWPAATTVVIHGGLNKRMEQMNEAIDADFVLCSYGPLSRQMDDMMALYTSQLKEFAIFFDEGGALRNTNVMSESAKRILTDREFAYILDATPFPNNVLIESYRLINILFPNQLGTMRAWKAQYAYAEKKEVTDGKTVTVYSKTNEMQEKISPFIFVKDASDPDVDAQLPDEPIVTQELFDMGPEQSIWYEHAVAETLDAIVNTIVNPNFENKHFILVKLMRQRQIAVTPWLVDKSYKGDEERFDLIIERILKWNTKHPTQGIIVGAFFSSMFGKLKDMIIEKADGRLKAEEVAIFDGSVSKLEDRARIENDFNSGKIKVMLAAFKTAGRGLNIQMNCNRIIITHKPWNPDDVKQIIGRINRQGQKNRVHVYELIANKTIDEHMEDVLLRKVFEQKELLSGQEMRSKDGAYSLDEIAKIAGIDVDIIKKKAKDHGFSLDDQRIKLGGD